MTKIDLGVIARNLPISLSSENLVGLFLSGLAMSATAANGDVIMKCGETLYKYEESFFGDDQIKVRWDGVWQAWCGDGRLELKDYSATCSQLEGDSNKGLKSQSSAENSESFFLTSAIDYAYTYCKCGLEKNNYDCFADHGIPKYTVTIANVELNLVMAQPNHAKISNEFCPVAENLSLTNVHKLFSTEEMSVRAMFRINSSTHIREVGRNTIDFLAHLLRFDTLTTECEVMDP